MQHIFQYIKRPHRIYKLNSLLNECDVLKYGDKLFEEMLSLNTNCIVESFTVLLKCFYQLKDRTFLLGGRCVRACVCGGGGWRRGV